MFRIADLLPPALGAFAPVADAPAERTAPSWFDEAASTALLIGADPGPASRGLSVAQHADRVLGHLCREPDDGA